MINIILLSLASLVALFAAAFFAGSETSFLSVSRERVLHLARAGGRKAKLVEQIISDMSRTTTTLLIGNNLSSVSYSTATAALALELFDESLALSIWGFFTAFVILYVSEFMPKLMCAARPLKCSLAYANTYQVMEKILSPLTWVAIALTNIFIPKRKALQSGVTSSDLLRILEDRKDGVKLSDFESALISRLIVLRIKGKPVTAEAILSALRDYE